MKNIFRFFVVIMIATLIAAVPSAAQTGTVLKEMSLQKDGARLNVLLRIDGTYAVEASFLPGPPRLVVDLTPMSQILVLPYTQIDDIGVLDVRTGQFKPDTARLVFDLSQNIPAYNIVQTAEGLKISFWYEGDVPPIQAPVQAEPVKPAGQTAPAAVAGGANRPGRFHGGQALQLFHRRPGRVLLLPGFGPHRRQDVRPVRRNRDLE